MNNLVWNVFVENVNSKKIEPYNVFSHTKFVKDLSEYFREYADSDDKNLDELWGKIKRSLMYWFWSKCEWEIILSGWPDSDTSEKIDVYDQIMLNHDRFFDYILEHGRDIHGNKEENYL